MENAEPEKIRAAVLRILQESDMTVMTESRVRELASKQIGIDLSKKPYKQRVQQLVKDFLTSEDVADADEEEEEEEEKNSGKASKEYSQHKKAKVTAKMLSPVRNTPGEGTRMDDGAILVCQLTSKRNVTVSDWKGTKLVSIREFYEKDGKTLPGKGISLTRDQWKAFKEGFADIDAAIKTIKGDE